MTLREEWESEASDLSTWVQTTSLPSGAATALYFLVDRLRALAARLPEAEKHAEPETASVPLAEALAPLRALADAWEACAVTTTLNANACGRYVREAAKRLADRLAESVPGGAEEGSNREALEAVEGAIATARGRLGGAAPAPSAEGRRCLCCNLALEEALRKMVREEVAKLGRGGDEPSLFTPEDWRNLYAGLAMLSLITKHGDEWPGDTQLAMRCWSFAELLSEPLRAGFSAPRPEPSEEHVAPDTSSTRRKP